MHAIVAEIVSGTVTKLVEVAVERIVRSAFAPRTPAAPTIDPVEEAAVVMGGFLQALADRDVDACLSFCDVAWSVQDDTCDLMNHTLSSAPPVSWAFTELHVPETWIAGAWLPWLVAEMVVTFDVGDGRFEPLPAVLRAVHTEQGPRINYLWWGESVEPEPEPAAELDFSQIAAEDFSAIFGQLFPAVDPQPVTAIVECARCGQKLRVPTDKGRLRVTCRKCANVQWYVP
jgi:hypothetical protein